MPPTRGNTCITRTTRTSIVLVVTCASACTARPVYYGEDDAAFGDTFVTSDTDPTGDPTATTARGTDESDATSSGGTDGGTGDSYGDPASDEGCLDNEIPVQLAELYGWFCSPPCSPYTYDCPEAAGASTATAECAVNDGLGSFLCALICTLSDGDGACPSGMKCAPVGIPDYEELAVCTWPHP